VTALTCAPHIPESTLPGRTAVLVERDRRRYAGAVDLVLADDPLTHVDPAESDDGVVLDERLVAVLAEAPDHPHRAPSAAFLAGRCTTGNAEADRVIHDALRGAVDAIDRTRRLGTAAALFVEGVMSLALLGDVHRAIALFTEQLTHPTRRSMEDALMAGYLAQLGGIAGYPILLQELRDPDSGQLRRNAVRQLPTFLPYDGQAIGDTTIDVDGELRRAASDASEYVADAVEDVRREFGLADQRA